MLRAGRLVYAFGMLYNHVGTVPRTSVGNVWNGYGGKRHNRRDGLATWVANTPGFGMSNHSKRYT